MDFFFRRPQAPTGDELVEQGVFALDAGQSARAICALESALAAGVRENPPAAVYTLLGQAYNQLGQHDRAIAALRRAILLSPRDHKVWNNLGVVYFDSGDLYKAMEYHQRALQLKPDYAIACASLGAVYYHKQEPAKAIPLLEKAVQLDPEITVAHSNLALAYAQSGRFAEAEAALAQAVRRGCKEGAAVRRQIEAHKASTAAAHESGPGFEPELLDPERGQFFQRKPEG
jgi:tetratricopeptide (TPR) repeat protein